MLCTLNNRFSQKHNGLSDGRVVSVTKNKCGSTFFLSPLKFIKFNIRWIIDSNFLKLFLLGIFIMKRYMVFSLTSFSTQEYDCVMLSKMIFSFWSLVNTSVTTEQRFFYHWPYQQSYHQIPSKLSKILLTTLLMHFYVVLMLQLVLILDIQKDLINQIFILFNVH